MWTLNDKPSIVAFTMVGCIHCDRLKPTLNELKEITGDIWNVIEVDRLNIDHNKLPFKIQGFPTIVFYDDKGSFLGEYTGDRTVEDMVTQALLHM